METDPQHQIEPKEKTMTTHSNLSRRLAAAASALLLSIVAVGGTFTVPAPAQAQTLYVGEIA